MQKLDNRKVFLLLVLSGFCFDRRNRVVLGWKQPRLPSSLRLGKQIRMFLQPVYRLLVVNTQTVKKCLQSVLLGLGKCEPSCLQLVQST